MLILNFNFDDKKFPEIEAQFEFSETLEQFFFSDFTENKQLLNEIIKKWTLIDRPVWFYSVSSAEYSRLTILVRRKTE